MSRTVGPWPQMAGAYLAGAVTGVAGFAVDGWIGAVMATALGLVTLVIAIRSICWERVREGLS